MKDNHQDIEKLFRESFDSFEADVDPNVWSNISSQIGTQAPVQDPSSAASSSSGGGSGIMGMAGGKIAAVVGTASILTVSGYFMFSGSDSEPEIPVKEKIEVVDLDKTEPNIEDQKDVQDFTVIESEEPNSEVINEEPVQESIQIETVQEDSENISQEENKLVVVDPVDAGATKDRVDEKKVVTPVASNDIAANEERESNKEDEDLSPEEEIELKDNFEASIYASIVSGKQPLEVRFENRGNFSTNVTWDFRDGSGLSHEPYEYHTFEKSGDYWVILKIVSEDGRVSKDSTKITVAGKAYVEAPNTFSPNGDGTNDAFRVESDYISHFKCTIFDRNQRLIFAWEGEYGHWDGRDNNGETVPEGVYFYVIEATDMDGNELPPNRGAVTLFR